MLNDVFTLYSAFTDKVKFLSLVKKIVEVSLQNDKEPVSSSTLDDLINIAKETVSLWLTATDAKEDYFSRLCLLIEVFCQLAAFGAEAYKHTLVVNGCFEFACELTGVVKLECDKLEQSGEWDSNAARTDPLNERVHPLACCKTLITNLLGSLTYDSNHQVDQYF